MDLPELLISKINGNRDYRIQKEAIYDKIRGLGLGADDYMTKPSYTVCCYSFDTDKTMYKQKMSSDYKMILKYLEQLRKNLGDDIEFVGGYEAGCLGYSLYHQLTDHGVKCVILAPTTMAITNTHRVKTDKRDAGNIARCLAFHTYSEVYVPTEEDNSIKEYIRMRDDQKICLKQTKQQIFALVLRLGKKYEGGGRATGQWHM